MNRSESGPRAAVAAVFAQQYCVIGRRQALDAGLSDDQIHWACRSGVWIPVHEAVYRLAAAPVTPEQQLFGGILATSGWGSHRSAGLIQGLDVPIPPMPEVATTSRRELDGVLVHRTRRRVDTQIEIVGGFPVTRPTRTILDLGSVLRPVQLEAAFDSGLRIEAFTLGSMERCLDAHGARGFDGAALLRELIENRRTYGVPRSQLEERVWKRFFDADIEPPVRNHIAHDDDGNRLGEIDLAWPWAMVGVECQSYRHHFGRQPWRRDIVKLNRLNAAGWAIFPATEEEAGRNFHVLLRQVKQALANRGA